ncbi:hypothetical protein ABKV19_013527, partial [Rosa sericea]
WTIFMNPNQMTLTAQEKKDRQDSRAELIFNWISSEMAGHRIADAEGPSVVNKICSITALALVHHWNDHRKV